MSQALALRYLFGGAVTYPPGARFGPRRLGDYELVWIIDGQATYHVDGQDIPAPTGSMVLCRPGVRDGFTWDPWQTTRHAYLHFMFTAAPDDWPAPSSWPRVVTMPDHDIVRPLFRFVLANGVTPTGRRTVPAAMTRRAMETMLGALLVGPVTQAFEHDPAYPQPIVATLGHIRRTLAREPDALITLTDLADAAKVSPEHLCRLFREALSLGPVEAVRLMRLDMAVQLLARSTLSIKQIAHRCGFASPYHFSRLISRVYDRSPSALRKRFAQGMIPPTSKLLRYLPMILPDAN